MTRQLMINNLTRMSEIQTQLAQSAEAAVADQQRSRLIEALKSQYQLDQQVKFLHLQAEADSLLQQLQSLKQQRQMIEAAPSQH